MVDNKKREGLAPPAFLYVNFAVACAVDSVQHARDGRHIDIALDSDAENALAVRLLHLNVRNRLGVGALADGVLVVG